MGTRRSRYAAGLPSPERHCVCQGCLVHCLGKYRIPRVEMGRQRLQSERGQPAPIGGMDLTRGVDPEDALVQHFRDRTLPVESDP